MSLRHIPTATDDEIRTLLDSDTIKEAIRDGSAHELIFNLANHIISLRCAVQVLTPKLDELDRRVVDMRNNARDLEDQISEEREKVLRLQGIEP